jgi:hypothetical protein
LVWQPMTSEPFTANNNSTQLLDQLYLKRFVPSCNSRPNRSVYPTMNPGVFKTHKIPRTIILKGRVTVDCCMTRLQNTNPKVKNWNGPETHTTACVSDSMRKLTVPHAIQHVSTLAQNDQLNWNSVCRRNQHAVACRSNSNNS